MAVGRFLAMAGVLVSRRLDGKYILLQRAYTRDWAPGEWECASGRLEEGEDFIQAARREAFEELGIEVRIECLLGTTHFYRGDTLPENEMIGVLFGCSVDDITGFELSDEHSAYKWVTAEEAQSLFPHPHFMGRLIARAETFQLLMPRELRQLHWAGDLDF